MTCNERLQAAARALRDATRGDVRLSEDRLSIECNLVPNPERGDLRPARALGAGGFAVWVSCDHQTAAERGDAAIPPPAESWETADLQLGDLPSAHWLIAEEGPTYIEIIASAQNEAARAEVDRILRVLRGCLPA